MGLHVCSDRKEPPLSAWYMAAMTVLIADTRCRPAATEEIRRKQALEGRPLWTRGQLKRKYQDPLDDAEEPFELDAPELDETEQVSRCQTST